MKRIFTILAAGVAGALITLLAMNFAAGAFAQGPSGQPAQPSVATVTGGAASQMGRGQMMGQNAQAAAGVASQVGRGQMMGQNAQATAGACDPSQMGGQGMGNAQADSLVGMAAAELNLTQADLIAQLGTEGTIAGALTAAGKDPAAFIDAFVAARAVRLDAAVAAGTMTRADADGRLALARSMSTARIYQPFSAMEHGNQGQGAGQGQGRGAGRHGGRP